LICYIYLLAAMSHFVLLLALSAVIVQSAFEEERIVNGKDATYAPWVVALMRSDGGSLFEDHYCSGTIINESWILTAAHCVAKEQPSELYIVAGIIDLLGTKEGQKGQVKKIIVHQRFSWDDLSNDISLLKLRRPLTLNNDVAVMELANQGDPLDIGQEYTVEGWGALGFPADKFPSVLQVLEGVPHYKIGKCFRKLPYISKQRHICAGGIRGYDACTGDSGGSLWRMVDSRPLLYGITSYGYQCATKLPGVYTKVSFFRKWIDKKMKYQLSNPL